MEYTITSYLTFQKNIKGYVKWYSTRKNKDPKDLGDYNRLRDLQHVEDKFPSARACPFPYLKDRPSPVGSLRGRSPIRR